MFNIKYHPNNNISTHEVIISCHKWKYINTMELYVAIMRLTRTSTLHINIYSSGTLDWYITTLTITSFLNINIYSGGTLDYYIVVSVM